MDMDQGSWTSLRMGSQEAERSVIRGQGFCRWGPEHPQIVTRLRTRSGGGTSINFLGLRLDTVQVVILWYTQLKLLSL